MNVTAPGNIHSHPLAHQAIVEARQLLSSGEPRHEACEFMISALVRIMEQWIWLTGRALDSREGDASVMRQFFELTSGLPERELLDCAHEVTVLMIHCTNGHPDPDLDPTGEDWDADAWMKWAGETLDQADALVETYGRQSR